MKVIDRLKEIVGQNGLIYDATEVSKFLKESLFVSDKLPVAVVQPDSVAQIIEIVKLAREEGIRIIPGGVVDRVTAAGNFPVENALLLSVSKMNRILEIDDKNLMVTVEAGVINADLQKAVEAQGLFYPPDPDNMNTCTIAENIELNASGLRSFKYGVTADYVFGVHLVTGEGELLQTGRKAIKDVAGYNLARLIAGSEGTLGVITQALLKLLPLPQSRKVVAVYFSTLSAAALAATRIIAEKITPSIIEILDNTALTAIEDYTQVGFAKDAGAMLLVELDGHPVAVNEDLAIVTSLCQQCNAYKIQHSGNSQESYNWLSARRSILKALRNKPGVIMLVSFFIPRSNLVEWLEAVSAIVKKHHSLSCIFGNAGSGKLQLALLGGENQQVNSLAELLKEIASLTVQLKGAIIGLQKTSGANISVSYLKGGEVEQEIMRLIKSAFDPYNLFPPVRSSMSD